MQESIRTTLAVANGDATETLRDFLSRLLTEGVVELLLLPMRSPAGSIKHALVGDAALLSRADPLAPVMPVNSAVLAGMVSIRSPRPKVGVVMRSCELRALIELVKLKQADLADLVLIAFDCAGTYSVTDFTRKEAERAERQTAEQEAAQTTTLKAALWQDLYKAVESDPAADISGLRESCLICESPVYSGAAIRFELLGTQRSNTITVSVAREIAEKLELEAHDPPTGEQAIRELTQARSKKRDSAFSKIRERLEGGGGLATLFSNCLRCHNCMTMCPLCYCKTCVFKSPLFDYEPADYSQKARQKGACALPADSTLFHLTRLNHMVLSCVGCGMCAQACPVDLPVGLVFRAIGQRVQGTFDYDPGKDPAQPLPLVTFKADEWNEVGEE